MSKSLKKLAKDPLLGRATRYQSSLLSSEFFKRFRKLTKMAHCACKFNKKQTLFFPQKSTIFGLFQQITAQSQLRWESSSGLNHRLSRQSAAGQFSPAGCSVSQCPQSQQEPLVLDPTIISWRENSSRLPVFVSEYCLQYYCCEFSKVNMRF